MFFVKKIKQQKNLFLLKMFIRLTFKLSVPFSRIENESLKKHNL